jgi:RNase P protein component
VEEHRHRCEVRQVLAWRTEDRGKAMDYLARVRQKRGDQAADRLEKDCRTQWERGNRGEKGDWRGL